MARLPVEYVETRLELPGTFSSVAVGALKFCNALRASFRILLHMQLPCR